MTDQERDPSLPDDQEIIFTSLDASDEEQSSLKPFRVALTARQRKVSLGLTGVLFLLVVALLLFSTPDIRNLLIKAPVSPNPTTAITSKNLSFYLQGNPSWGQFTVDGQRIGNLFSNGLNRTLSFAPGTHQIVWQVTPFQSQNCVFTVVNSTTFSSPCLTQQKVESTVLDGSFAPTPTPTILFTFFASLNDLPVAQRMNLAQQIQTTIAAYDDSEQVRQGEVYAVSTQLIKNTSALCKPFLQFALCLARATQSLTAHLSIQVDTSSSPDDPCVASGYCNVNQTDCRRLCNPFYPFLTNQGAASWNVAAIVRLIWSYITPTGQVIASSQPDSAIRSISTFQNLQLSIARNGQNWEINTEDPSSANSSNNPFCSQAMQDLSEIIQPDSSSYEQQWSILPGHIAAGCLVAITRTPEASATPAPIPTTQPKAYFLQHFGVLLAVNATAHNLLPELPIADTYELQLAKTLATILPSA